MRYKPYILAGRKISCGSVLYNRYGSDFVEVKPPNNIEHRRATEIKDGVWFIGSPYGSKYGDTYLVPEGNEYFNFYPLKKGIFDSSIDLTKLNAIFEIDVSVRVSNLILKYFFSLKL